MGNYWFCEVSGRSNELILHKNIEYGAIRTIFGPTREYSAWFWPWNRFERLFVVWTFKKEKMNFLIEDILNFSILCFDHCKSKRLYFMVGT